MDKFKGTCPRCGSYNIKFPRAAMLLHNYQEIMRICHCNKCAKNFALKNNIELLTLAPAKVCARREQPINEKMLYMQ